MLRYIVGLAFLWLLAATDASAQAPATVKLCVQNGTTCTPVVSGTPLPVSATFTPSGTQNVNIAQILGAAPSLTNPLWVFPATGAAFAVTQSTSPWIVAGGGTAGTPGTAALTIQGIGSGTPVPVSGTVTVTEPTTTNVASSALAANQVINAAAASLYSFNVSADSTLSGAAWWIMIYNATSAPTDGAVTPARCYAMASGSTSFSAAFPVGLPFATGIVIGVSTTGCFTKTASAHAFISGDYK